MQPKEAWGHATAFLERFRRVGWFDFFLLAGLVGAIFGVLSLAGEWREFRPAVHIDLAPSALPRYVFYSLSRGLLAYVCSLAFTLTYGFWAAKDPVAQRILIPLLDILQSIPVLGFMPGVVLALARIFPGSNVGLELASILMIFTGQAWNMTFSFYHSIRSVPKDQIEAATIYRFNWWERLKWVELPFSMIGLVWNSMMSMAGGWFFLMITESFVLGSKDFRLPGIGSYMSVAVARGDVRAMIWAVVAMVTMIVVLDQLLWRPVVVWSQKFRGEEGSSERIASSGIFQPIVQIAAAFPAPMLFPVVIALLKATGVSLGWGSIVLMLLGTQWYILFNVIAGATAIPADLREAADSYRLDRWLRFRSLYLPAVFPYLVTGWVTAAGGAWNASIVAEYFTFRHQILTTIGLGAEISIAAERANFPALAASVILMATIVVLFNRTVWRRLYALAEERFLISK